VSGYVIGSGWWSAGEDTDAVNPLRSGLGDQSIRRAPFFEIWLESIRRNTSPEAIAVVDSAAPEKPAAHLREGIAWLELPFNAKHSTDHLGRWSGWTRSVMLSGQYALLSDAEYFVYVEQDCLLAGRGIVERCIAAMTRDFMFGDGAGTPQPLQQSFFIVRRRALPAFLRNLAELREADSALSPERKFLLATSTLLVRARNAGLLGPRLMRRLVRLAPGRRYDLLPIGSGRARPIPVEAPHYYFQHGSQDELDRYLGQTLEGPEATS